MDSCNNQSFYTYFQENMEELGLDVPKTLFNTQAKAAWTIGSILGAIKTLGAGATLHEIARATTGLEKLAVLNAASAAYYAGAAVGSFAVATGRYAACGATLADVAMSVRENGISVIMPMWLDTHLRVHPEIIDKNIPNRSIYALKIATYR